MDEKREEVRFVAPDWVKSPPPAMDWEQLGSQFILGLHNLIKAARVHGIDNVAEGQSIFRYLHLVNPCILSEGGVTLEIADGGLLLNNRRIRGKPRDRAAFKSFMRTLIGCRIGKVEIHNPLDERELTEFISLLVALKDGDENNSLHLMEQLSARKIDSITAGRSQVRDQALLESPEGGRQARELYFTAIGVVQAIMEELVEGRELNIRKAKRLMQQMVTLFTEDEFVLLGLAVIKDYGEYLCNHSVNVAIYSIALGRQLEFPKGILVQLGIAGLFHDIGKIRIPPSILGKSGQLTADEWRVIQRHPVYGVETIAQASGWGETTARMIETALEHHVKEDRTGYPRIEGKRGLTLFGKIVGIADFYDNLVRSPFYRLFPVFSDRATALLLDRSGADFDPALVKLFVRVIGLYPIGTLVMLQNGEMGIVVTPSRDVELMDRPKVLRIQFRDGEYKGSGVLDLAEVEDDTGKYKNSIAKPLDPNEYQINVAELLFYG